MTIINPNYDIFSESHETHKGAQIWTHSVPCVRVSCNLLQRNMLYRYKDNSISRGKYKQVCTGVGKRVVPPPDSPWPRSASSRNLENTLLPSPACARARARVYPFHVSSIQYAALIKSLPRHGMACRQPTGKIMKPLHSTTPRP